jgi:hypothetical protein
MHYRELWIRNAMGKSLLWTTSSKARIPYSLMKCLTSTCLEGSRHPIFLFFQVVKTQSSTWITSELTCLYTRHPTRWRAELFPSPCQERPETGSGTFSQNRLIISILLVGSSWPSLCPREPGGNPEGIYSPCDRGQTNL